MLYFLNLLSNAMTISITDNKTIPSVTESSSLYHTTFHRKSYLWDLCAHVDEAAGVWR